MDSKILQAMQAYQARTNALKNGGASESAPDQATGDNGFLGMVRDAMQQGVDTLKQTEQARTQAMTGKVDLTDLVTAVANAEMTVNTVVAVRDRVISAYQDIIRMPI